MLVQASVAAMKNGHMHKWDWIRVIIIFILQSPTTVLHSPARTEEGVSTALKDLPASVHLAMLGWPVN